MWCVAGAPPDFHKSTADLVELGRKHRELERQEESGSSLNSQSTADSSQDPTHSGYAADDTEGSMDDRDAIGDLLDEAMDSDAEEPSTSRERASPVVMGSDNINNFYPDSIDKCLCCQRILFFQSF